MPDRFAAAISFAQDLIRIPGLSGHEENVAQRVRVEFDRLGFLDVRSDRVGNVIGRVPGTGEGATVLLNSHMDVVAEGDHSEWEYPPFEAVIAHGELHGRGAMDIKGPLALQTHVAAALAGKTPGDILVAHTVFEERGGLGMKSLIETGEIAPDVCVIGESTHGDICIGHRGRAEVEVFISGKAGHASAPERAANAILLLPAVLAGIERAARDLPSDPILGQSTMVPSMIDVLPQSRNVIPDSVVVAIDWRILPGMTEDTLLARVRDAVMGQVGDQTRGCTVTVRMATEAQRAYTDYRETRNLMTPGFLMDPTDPIVQTACEVVGNREEEGPAVARPWTFATDGGWSCGINGIPSIGFAPGEERFAHTNRERLDLAEARWAFDRYVELIPALQKVAPRRSA